LTSHATVTEFTPSEAPSGGPGLAPWTVASRGAAIGAAATMAVVASIVLAAPVPPESRAFLLWGGVAGGVAGTLGNWIVARGALRRVGGKEASADFVRSIFLDFVLQVFAVVAGTMCLYLLQLKFQEFAAFGATLAGAAVLFRAPGTVLVSRALSARAEASRSARPDDSSPQEDATSAQEDCR
jgi:hypothetical protein